MFLRKHTGINLSDFSLGSIRVGTHNLLQRLLNVRFIRERSMFLKHHFGNGRAQKSGAGKRPYADNVVKSGLWIAVLVDAFVCRLAHSESQVQFPRQMRLLGYENP
jgi:hypothetical protein